MRGPICRRTGVALCVIKSDGRHLAAPPNDESTYGCEEDADKE